ncbi:multiple sugar transport system permease protein [Mobilisporobacter senegalensis]|uniref:Multiple sugar transport system permease protein n=1 Tax=Mobilisporobacter senegalensis TaxID=1329262 RepID=A0A3N1X342_9FIRM|nr:carbohydrate ABC transporter permease [Mobilisporobacter senegalensis]ROR21219.1 multiple sugar transport system permease protein [Mobilisporobacter senegalensis]
MGRKRKKIKLSTIIITIVTLIILAISLFPYYYMVLQSFLPWNMVDKALLPKSISLDSYRYLLGGNSAGSADPWQWVRALINSFVVSVPTAIISVLVGLMTGYAATHMEYKGKGLIYSSLLFQMFFPIIILLVPRYMLIRPLANNYLGMLLPLIVSIWGIFMYINYFKTIPNVVFEAAKIDGATHFQILLKIALPSTKSISIIVFLSVFMTRWNELIWDMLVAPDYKMQTLNVMISTQFNQNSTVPGPMYAASVLLTLPVIILFLCFSKYFKEGINFMLK